MEAYTGFAQLYDLFMDNVPYDAWTEEIAGRLRSFGIPDGLVCELGCGTGELTRRLADAGYDMIGIDRSPEMLGIAMESERAEGTGTGGENNRLPVLYLQQDIRAFELYGTVRAFVAVCDTVNYLLEEEDLEKMFRLVNNYLDPDGIFLFSLDLPSYYESIGDDVIAENRDEASFIWENEYDPEEMINIYGMTFFAREEDGWYRKFEEEHVQRAYTLPQVKELLAKSGLRFVSAEDAERGGDPDEDTKILWITARECGKVKDYV